MKYRIEKQGDEVVIRFEELGGDAQAVIDAIGRCRINAFACSSGECDKIGGMASCGEPDTLALRLKPRTDLSLDVATLGECLKYHLPRHFHDEK